MKLSPLKLFEFLAMRRWSI